MPEICPDKKYILDVLRDLVAFKTSAPPGNFYHEIVDYLEPIFKGMGFKTEKIIMPQEIFVARCDTSRLRGDRVNLRASLDVGAEKTLVIYTHLDVVPTSDTWSTDPFVLTQVGDRVYGRGVSDSKGGVAGMIAALQAVMKSGRPKYNLSILLTTDEEVGGYSGLCYLVDEGLVKGDFMLCMDGFSDDLVIGSNGIITWEIEVKGRSAHSGSSFLGVNAIEKSLPIMQALMALKEKIQSRRSTLNASSALAAVGLKNLQPMLNITVINAGIKENIVPDKCVMRGDRRVMPEETMEAAEDEFEAALKGIYPDMKVRFFPGYPPMYVNPDNHWVLVVRESIERVTGFMPKLSGSQGSLDQAYATDKTNIPTCVYGVGRQIESNIHGDDENVRISDLESFARVMIALISA